jgi:hypothetical protein
MQQRSLIISESSKPRESQGKNEKRKNRTLRKSLPPFPPTHQKNLPVSQSFKELERDARKLVKSQRSSLLPQSPSHPSTHPSISSGGICHKSSGIC